MIKGNARVAKKRKRYLKQMHIISRVAKTIGHRRASGTSSVYYDSVRYRHNRWALVTVLSARRITGAHFTFGQPTHTQEELRRGMTTMKTNLRNHQLIDYISARVVYNIVDALATLDV